MILPSMNQLAIDLKNVDLEGLKELLKIYNLEIIAYEPDYVIVDGDYDDIRSFKEYWNV